MSVSLIRHNEYLQAINKLDEYFEDNRNILVERAEFLSMRQHADETTGQFAVRLRQKAARCDFRDEEGQVMEQLIRMRKVMGQSGFL